MQCLYLGGGSRPLCSIKAQLGSSAPHCAAAERLHTRRASANRTSSLTLQIAQRKAGGRRPSGPARLAPVQAKLSKRYAADAVSAVKLGQVEACKLGQNYAGPEHLLLGILAESDGLPLGDKGIAARLLEEQGVSLKQARVGVEDVSGSTGKGLVLQIAEVPLSSKADAVLDQAKKEALRLGTPESIGNEHILMALLADDKVCKLLRKLGADVLKLKEDVLEVTLKETAARRPSSADSKKGGAANVLARLAFLPLAAMAALLQPPATLGCVAVAAMLCAAALLSRRSWLHAAVATLLGGAVGWLGSQAAAAAANVEPRLLPAMQCCGAVLALGLAATVA